jgi:hypothetical protein
VQLDERLREREAVSGLTGIESPWGFVENVIIRRYPTVPFSIGREVAPSNGM